MVCSIDDGASLAGYREADWGYLRRGVLVEFETAMGLVHYEDEMEPDLELVSRAPLP